MVDALNFLSMYLCVCMPPEGRCVQKLLAACLSSVTVDACELAAVTCDTRHLRHVEVIRVKCKLYHYHAADTPRHIPDSKTSRIDIAPLSIRR